MTIERDTIESEDIGVPEIELRKIPDDFPRYESIGNVPGAQLKFLATEYNGRFYLSGCTPPEIYRRWKACDNLAAEVSSKSADANLRALQQIDNVEILDLYLTELIQLSWISVAEARWTIRRAAEILRWPIPLSAEIRIELFEEDSPRRNPP